jgi:hypothetical protein
VVDFPPSLSSIPLSSSPLKPTLLFSDLFESAVPSLVCVMTNLCPSFEKTIYLSVLVLSFLLAALSSPSTVSPLSIEYVNKGRGVGVAFRYHFLYPCPLPLSLSPVRYPCPLSLPALSLSLELSLELSLYLSTRLSSIACTPVKWGGGRGVVGVVC